MDLRFSFHDHFGRVLSGRAEGKKAFEAISRELEKLSDVDTFSIDLSGVNVLNPSYADETVGEAVSRFPKRCRIVGNVSLAADRSLTEVEKSRNIHIPRFSISA